MELIAKERDRLLTRATRIFGTTLTLVTVFTLSIPGVVDLTNLFAALLLSVVLLYSLYRVGNDQSLLWLILGVTCGVAILVVIQIPFGTRTSPTLTTAILPLAGGALATFALLLTRGVARILILIMAFAATIGLVLVALDGDVLSYPFGAVALSWILFGFAGLWVSSSVPKAAKRIFSIGLAHRAERVASELEAQRRQDARLLHDTVLATLTLLAHSGVGVSKEALRAQAAEDAQLLRQLRLETGTTPQGPMEFSGQTVNAPPDDAVLETTLESVKHRFDRIGLEVSWHGTGQVLLPADVLDAFLLALAECLENVRRHSGVTEAHVTITDDDESMRAMVTDSGIGFDLADIDSARLGIKDSVIGRLAEVGGTVRLFSSPGSGTTVVLEVPK